jgi:hypothetical protein
MLDLLEINPALVFALAVASRNEARFCLPPDPGELRQRELAFYLRFPESEAVVRILRKIPPEALSEDRLNRLRNAVASPELLKALSHLAVVSAAVIALTTEQLLFTSVTPSFLAEVAQDDGGAEGEGVAVLLRESLQMRAQMDPGRSVRVDSLARLRQVHGELLRDYARWVEARIEASKFPPPPVPSLLGVVEPLDSAEQLVLEGRQQSNCVASYAPRVREGRVFIYRVLQPERATLSLIRTEAGRWEIGELKASRNRPVSEQTLDLVEQWLSEWQLSGRH